MREEPRGSRGLSRYDGSVVQANEQEQVAPEEGAAVNLDRHEQLARWQQELEEYNAKKAEYDKLVEENSHIDFALLTFLPEIQEAEPEEVEETAVGEEESQPPATEGSQVAEGEGEESVAQQSVTQSSIGIAHLLAAEGGGSESALAEDPLPALSQGSAAAEEIVSKGPSGAAGSGMARSNQSKPLSKTLSKPPS